MKCSYQEWTGCLVKKVEMEKSEHQIKGSDKDDSLFLYNVQQRLYTLVWIKYSNQSFFSLFQFLFSQVYIWWS